MGTIINALIVAIAVVALAAPAAFAAEAGDRGKLISRSEGGYCYELDFKEAEASLKKMEKLLAAGKLKAAFDMAAGGTPGCSGEDAEDRVFNVIERTYKQLGQQAEKAGRTYEAHKYYDYPRDRYFVQGGYQERKKHYSYDDANRTMLAYAKANRNDYKIVQEAVSYFRSTLPGRKSHLKEVQDLAIRGGDSVLAREEKDFAARRYKAAYDGLNESKMWFGLADDERRVQTRAKQRSDALLSEGTYDSVDRANSYCIQFNVKRDAVKLRAGKLGDAAEKKGDLELAEKFYYLSGDEAKYKSVSARLTAIQEQKDRREEQKDRREEQREKQREQAEPKRQEKFKKDQQSLEQELGL